MKKSSIIVVAVFGLISITCNQSATADNTGEILVNAAVIYPKYRIWTSPSSGEEAQYNSPSLQWPVRNNQSYSIRLSSDKDFAQDLLTKKDIPFAMFNPHQMLKKGKWFWQYKIGDKDWEKIDSFVITKNTKEFVTPTVEKLIANIPSFHPRVMVNKDEWIDFKNRAESYPDSKIIIGNANKDLNLLPPKENSGLSVNAGKTPKQNKKIALIKSKELGNEVGEVLDNLVQAYVLTTDEKYFVSAKKWMLEVASWDPTGVTKLNDFGDSRIMASMALGLDAFWDLLAPAERKVIIVHVAARANGFYHKYLNRTEARSTSMHLWQHILHRMLQTSVVLVGETPDAPGWIEYIYELWIAQNPKMAESDGAWMNGVGYYTMNVLTQFDVSKILNAYTGVDFMRQDWYRNLPKWMIYAYPADGVSDGFCNGGDFKMKPDIRYAGLGDLFGRFTKNKYAVWYSKRILEENNQVMSQEKSFRWFRIQHANGLQAPPPADRFDLPQSAIFPEAGLAYMNTSVEEAKNNLMLSIKSSPFGPMGHTHADQNTFNIAFGGKRLFYNSGYRPAMGDPHFLEDHMHTRGHNSILIDGNGQPINAGAYGYLPRFLQGNQITYAVGDASNAYSGGDMGEKIDYGMKRFRRHYIMLKPLTLVIYDELEANHNAEWTWLIHNDDGLDVDIANKTINAENEVSEGQVTLFSSSPIRFKVTDKFTVYPENFINKKDGKGRIKTFKDQWHFSGTSLEKTKAMRYLAIIQITPKKEGSKSQNVVYDAKSDTYSIGDWQIKAEMNTENAAQIEVQNKNGNSVLISSGSITLGDNIFNGTVSGSSKLVEKINGKMVFKESVDSLPISIQRVLNK